MPTGYTAPLYDGENLTFKEFALRCSRAMGAAIMQRDDPLDSEIALRTVDDYFKANIDKALADLSTAEKRTPEEWARIQKEELAKEDANAKRHAERKEKTRQAYMEMLARVKAWVPPTSEHQGLKKFMTEQLEESIRWDCGEWSPDVPERLSTAEYRDRKIAALQRTLRIRRESLAKEEALVASQNKWVTALRDSLEAKENK